MILIKTYFFLRDENAKKKTSILCKISYQKERIVVSTGLSIVPKDWHKKKQCSNSDNKINKKINTIKERLSTYEKDCQLLEKEIRIDDTRIVLIDPEKDELVKTVKNKRLFTNFIQRYYDLNINVKAWNTIKKYTTLKNLFEFK